MVSLLKPIPIDEFVILYDMLKYITIPIKNSTNSRHDFRNHRSMTMGITRGRFNGIIGLSQPTKKYPHIYKEILRIQKLIGIEANSIHINHNVICPRHLDSKNIGESVLVSFGDYTGCHIVIDELPYDAYCQPIKFNGAELIYYDTNNLIGNKYSLVFFN